METATKATVKPSDFRIGNFWLDATDGQRKKISGQLLSLFEEEIKSLQTRIQPIPLTQEILERCGFAYDTNYQTWGIDGTRFMLRSLDHEVFQLAHAKPLIPRMKYVHQLQNLYFALTGEELQLEL